MMPIVVTQLNSNEPSVCGKDETKKRIRKGSPTIVHPLDKYSLLQSKLNEINDNSLTTTERQDRVS